MITIHTKKETTGQKTPSRTALGLLATPLLAAGIFLSMGSTAFAQQRVIVEKATGNVVDVGGPSLQYDQRYYDHMDVAVNPIPRGQDVRKYMRDAAGAIVLRPKDERVAAFADDRRDELISRINALALPADVKSLLIEIVKGLRN
jgi:hypothetical protein